MVCGNLALQEYINRKMSYRIYPMVRQTVEWYTSITFPVALQYKWKSVTETKIVNLNSLRIEDNWDFKQNVLTWSSSGITFVRKKYPTTALILFLPLPSQLTIKFNQSYGCRQEWRGPEKIASCTVFPGYSRTCYLRFVGTICLLVNGTPLFHVVLQASELLRTHY